MHVSLCSPLHRWGGSFSSPRAHDVYIANMRDTVRRVRNHASLLLWCGGNELAPRGFAPPSDIAAALRVALVPTAATEAESANAAGAGSSLLLDGTRPYVPSSMASEGPPYALARADGPYDLRVRSAPVPLVLRFCFVSLFRLFSRTLGRSLCAHITLTLMLAALAELLRLRQSRPLLFVRHRDPKERAFGTSMMMHRSQNGKPFLLCSSPFFSALLSSPLPRCMIMLFASALATLMCCTLCTGALRPRAFRHRCLQASV